MEYLRAELNSLEKIVSEVGMPPRIFRDILVANKVIGDGANLTAEEVIAKAREFFNEHRDDLIDIIKLRDGLSEWFSNDIKEVLKREGIDINPVDASTYPINPEERAKIWQILKNANVNVEFITNSRVLKRIVRMVKRVTDEARILFTHSGIEIRAVNQERTMMVDVQIAREVFEEYSVQMPRVVAVNFATFDKALRAIGDAGVSAVIDRSHILVSEKREDSTSLRSVKVALLDPKTVQDAPKLPKIDWTGEFTVEEFSKTITTHSLFGDYIVIEMRDGMVTMKSEDEDGGVMDDFDGDGEGYGMYSHEYLLEVARGIGAETATIKIGKQVPMRIEADIDGVAVQYFIAPRLSD